MTLNRRDSMKGWWMQSHPVCSAKERIEGLLSSGTPMLDIVSHNASPNVRVTIIILMSFLWFNLSAVVELALVSSFDFSQLL